MLKYNYYYIQFLEHFLILIILLSSIILLKTKKMISLQKNKFFNSIIIFISSISLEIYLTHAYLKEFPIGLFPFNIFLFISFTLMSAYLLKIIFSLLENIIKDYKLN